jgi:FMN reductase
MHPAENRGDVDGEIRAAVIVGNPKPDSRTLRAAQLVAQQLAHVPPVLVADLAKLGAELLGPDSEPVASLVRTLQEVDLLVVASPTYKGTFSGLLKLFLDQIAADALSAVVVIPLMLGAGPGHALAPEVFLKPVLAELGASCPTKALYLIDREWDDQAVLDAWLKTARPRVLAALGRSEPVL